MSDLSTPPRARLFTTFGTVLYVDIASGELRHGPIDTSPANAVFVADQTRSGRWCGSLMHIADDRLQSIICSADHSWSISAADAPDASVGPTPLQLLPLERGLVGLQSEGLYLCAEPDSRVTLSRLKCSRWECFLASEDWCTGQLATDREQDKYRVGSTIDWRSVADIHIDPMLRIESRRTVQNKKLLVYGYKRWSHGRVYYDVSKLLHERGYIVDIIDWLVPHSPNKFTQLLSHYDFIITSPDGVGVLVNNYGVPYERIIALTHGEHDMRALLKANGQDVFDKFANYGVVSEFLYSASLTSGVKRVPVIAPLGINYSEFYSDISDRLTTVGYTSSMSLTIDGVEWKRGELAEVSAREAGLEFRVAGSTQHQTLFLDMPDFYRTVHAVLMTSISEGANLPVMEAAAAGRLVIGTPVGHFPLRAYGGGGILAPIQAEKFKDFAVKTLRYYKENAAAYFDKCSAIQEAARKFDWQYSIGEWIELIETARPP